jgi:hypothetical protein
MIKDSLVAMTAAASRRAEGRARMVGPKVQAQRCERHNADESQLEPERACDEDPIAWRGWLKPRADAARRRSIIQSRSTLGSSFVS